MVGIQERAPLSYELLAWTEIACVIASLNDFHIGNLPLRCAFKLRGAPISVRNCDFDLPLRSPLHTTCILTTIVAHCLSYTLLPPSSTRLLYEHVSVPRRLWSGRHPLFEQPAIRMLILTIHYEYQQQGRQ